jgi:alpha-tubulin suppressor-like RCC1 family protein
MSGNTGGSGAGGAMSGGASGSNTGGATSGGASGSNAGGATSGGAGGSGTGGAAAGGAGGSSVDSGAAGSGGTAATDGGDAAGDSGDSGAVCTRGAVELTVGWYHACGRKADGTLWCWGRNGSGELGNGMTEFNRSSPVEATAVGRDVAQVSAGDGYTCARKTDGSVWCWGRNNYGQMGRGSTGTGIPTPAPVTLLGTNVAQVAAGGQHACARKTDGSLYCWGYNGWGQVGDGTSVLSVPSPVQVASLGTTVAEVTTGANHTCARKTDGSLWCWGYNMNGQIGGGGTRVLMPAQITALGTDVVGAAAGEFHTCARKSDGSLWCWGRNQHGIVTGNGMQGLSAISPTQVATLGTNVVGVAANSFNTCVRKSDGTLWCWGWNDYGQIGDGTRTTPKLFPVQNTALDTNVVGVGVGQFGTCALKTDQSLWCWGRNDYGQTGDGTTEGAACDVYTCRVSPVAVGPTCP